MIVRLLAILAMLVLAAPVCAQTSSHSPGPVQQAQQSSTAPQDPDKPVTYEEQVVVTASKSEQQLVNAPAAVSLVTTETIQNSPAASLPEPPVGTPASRSPAPG